ncbi:MAG: hypothetical protein ABS69_08520 [Nitrosomonadales bacterium SCN 54-20]|nr:MAG: hypothetical protein ABS69_08520 [Nitrosomonadales bacterium SCN 54-20]
MPCSTPASFLILRFNHPALSLIAQCAGAHKLEKVNWPYLEECPKPLMRNICSQPPSTQRELKVAEAKSGQQQSKK